MATLVWLRHVLVVAILVAGSGLAPAVSDAEQDHRFGVPLDVIFVCDDDFEVGGADFWCGAAMTYAAPASPALLSA